MRIKRLNDMFTVATQLELNKIRKISETGDRTIICNRPDGEGEGEDQPGPWRRYPSRSSPIAGPAPAPQRFGRIGNPRRLGRIGNM